jgi:translocation and assembly module TamB
VARTRRNGIPGWSNVPWTARGRLRAAPTATLSETEAAPSWQVTLTSLAVTTLGGQLVGSATVRGADRGPETTLDFEARRLSLTAMTEAMSALPVRLASLQWAGAASGPLRAQFVGRGHELKVEADWDVEPLLVVPPQFTPVSGKLAGSYDAARRRLETVGSHIELPRTRLQGEGWFDDSESQMRLAIDTSDLDENHRLAQLLGQDLTSLPVRLRGEASATVEWTGGTEQARIAGDFRMTDFTYQDHSWDRFAGQLDYLRRAGAGSPEDHGRPVGRAASNAEGILEIRSGVLTSGDTGLNFNLRVNLQDGHFTDQTPFELQGRIQNGRLEKLQALAGRHEPIRGNLQGSFEISGTRQAPVGKGSVEVTEGSYREENFDRLRADLRLAPGGLWTAEDVRLKKEGGTAQGELSFNQRTEEFRFNLAAAEIALSSIQALQSTRWRTSGVADGTLSGEGTLERPQLRGEIRLRQFGFGLTQPGTLTMSVESREGRAYWTMTGTLWNGDISIRGETMLQGRLPSVADVSFERVDLLPLVKTVREPPANLQGELRGTLRAEANARDFSDFRLRGELAALQATVNQVSVRSIGPVPFQYQDRLLRLERLRLEGPRAELETSGTILLGPDPVLDLNARGQMDLTALGQEDAELVPAGRVQLDAQFSGTVRRPLWRGRLRLTEASLHYGELPNGLERINGTVVFEGNRGVLENVTAESGGGQLQLSGFVLYGEAGEWQFNLAAEATEIRIRYPEGLSTWVNGRLSWTGTPRDSLLEGRVLLTRQSVSPRFDLVQVLLQRREETSPAAQPEILRNLRLNLEVSSATDLRLDTLTARNLQTAVELRIQGTVAQPAWLGRIGILEGEILFAGKRYAINRGEISFLNPFRFEPVLSLSVQARVQRYDIAMDFSGPADRLTVTYRSDPPLPTSDILALLVAGSARDTSLETSINQPLPEVGAEALLSQALQSQIGSRLDRLFGSGRLRVDPQISGLGRSTNASIALEQQLSEDFSVLYITDVTSTQQQTIQAEWNISPRLSVVAIRDQNGLVGVNFQITLRFR